MLLMLDMDRTNGEVCQLTCEKSGKAEQFRSLSSLSKITGAVSEKKATTPTNALVLNRQF